MSVLKNKVIKDAARGFFMDGKFIGIRFVCVAVGADFIRLYPYKLPIRHMDIDAATLTLLNADGMDETPQAIGDKAALLNKYISGKGVVALPPLNDTIIRHFKSRTGYTLTDLYGNDGVISGLVSIVSASTVIEFDDLTGVTIVSYEGDQVLSISGNNIIASGDGEVHSILLSNGVFIPVFEGGIGFGDNDLIVEFTANNTTKGYTDEGEGSLWNLDHGCTMVSPTVYGVEWDSSIASKDMNRVGGFSRHQELNVQKKLKRCLVSDAVEVTYLQGGEILDGSQGQVMVEIPEFWYNHEVEGDIHRFLVCEHVQAGWYHHKKSYISAFEATVQRSTSKLSSVINTDVDYRGGNNNATWDLAANGLLGMPATNHTRAEFRNFATNRGIGWHQYGAYDHYLLAMLAVIEYATWDLQKAFNPELDENGFRQGGLGVGPTSANSTEWSNFSSYNPVLPCGSTLSLGNESGEVEITVPDFGGEGIDRTFKSNSYRGVENPFGHIWKFIDGFNISDYAAYLSDNYENFADDTTVNYESVGMLPAANGWQQNVGSHFLPLPSEVGTSSGYVGDYFWQDSGWRVALVGGSLNNGSAAGSFFLGVNYSSARRIASIGARLCYSPQNLKL